MISVFHCDVSSIVMSVFQCDICFPLRHLSSMVMSLFDCLSMWYLSSVVIYPFHCDILPSFFEQVLRQVFPKLFLDAPPPSGKSRSYVWCTANFGVYMCEGQGSVFLGQITPVERGVSCSASL